MKKKMKFFVPLVLFVGLISVVSAFAISFPDDGERYWFNVKPRGPISVNWDVELSLKVRITNDSDKTRYVKELLITVIDPFDGTRVFGPESYSVDLDIPAGETSVQEILLGPFEESNKNKTVGAVILVVGSKGKCRGAGGWGFVIE